MANVQYTELLEAGVHFGHLTRKWNPKMAPYIFMEKNGIHIIDLHKTVAKLDEASTQLKQIAKSGKKVLFVATKNQAKSVVSELVDKTGMPFITERWSGGMLTNFATIRKAVKKMKAIEKMEVDGTFENISKKERLQFTRQKDKLNTNLGSIADLTRLPAAIFVVDITKEHIAVKEAKKLGIPCYAIVDTNSDPTSVDFPIPANDDSSVSIEAVLKVVCSAMQEGLEERKAAKSEPKAAPAKEDKAEVK
jgi:small subunit ribosomal protein S2